MLKSGERMFHLLLYAFCMTDRISQRRVETMFNSQQFKTLFDYAEGMTVSRSYISTRLSKMNVESRPGGCSCRAIALIRPSGSSAACRWSGFAIQTH